jgi:hypothetical protein
MQQEQVIGNYIPTGAQPLNPQLIKPTIPPQQPYYYSITGDYVIGNNKSDPQFGYDLSRFKIDEPVDITIQGQSWEKPSEEESVPYMSVGKFFQGIAKFP